MKTSIQEFALLPQEEKDRFFMKRALEEASYAFENEEVPVGAVLVVEDKIVAKGRNQVESLKDATAHAEMLCLSSASEHFNDWRYKGATLYTTLEPCPMCAGAIFACRIKRVVWGAPDLRLGANGSFCDLFSLKHPMCSVEVSKQVLLEESAYLMQSFFQKRRKKNEKNT